MLVRIEKQKGGWAVFAMQGRFFGQRVATAECVRLTEAQFKTNHIIGELVALWGAEVDDHALEDTSFSRAFGSRAVFNTCDSKAFRSCFGWLDAHDYSLLTLAKVVSVMGDRVYYTTAPGYLQRRLPDSVTPQLPVVRTWEQLTAALSRLTHKKGRVNGRQGRD